MSTISLEFFPPSTTRGNESLSRELAALAALRPSFVSVTCGAGGSTRRLTRDALTRVQQQANVDAAPHLICVDASRDEIDGVVEEYMAMGVRHIVALRGDPPRGAGPFRAHPKGYGRACELVADVARLGVPEISVAAYPEVHPEARSAEADLANLKSKIDAGATRSITQFFFDADTFLRFRDKVRGAGIEAPLVPGILPVGNFARIREFAKRCGATIPRSVEQRFADLDAHPSERDAVAIEFAAELCTRLKQHGVRGFHFYTMNRSSLTLAVCAASGLAASVDATAEH